MTGYVIFNAHSLSVFFKADSLGDGAQGCPIIKSKGVYEIRAE